MTKISIIFTALCFLTVDHAFGKSPATKSQANAARFGPASNVKSLGAMGDGTTDDTAILQAALTASASGGEVVIPCGVYKIVSPLSVTIAAGKNISITGSGSDCVEIYAVSTNGLVITYASASSSMNISGVTLTTGKASTSTVGLAVTAAFSNALPAFGAVSTFTNVVFRGRDGYGVKNYWGTGVQLSGVSNFNFIAPTFAGSSAQQGTGIVVAGVSKGCSGPCIAVVFNVSMGTFFKLDNGFVYGNYVQGVNISQSNFTGLNRSIWVPTSETLLGQLTITGSQFGDAPILIHSSMPGATIVGNYFIVFASKNALAFTGDFFAITGNYFAGSVISGNNGIVCTGSGPNGGHNTIAGSNTFTGLQTGILLNATCNNTNVQSNSYSNNTSNTNDLGAGNTIGGGSP
jgi:hypothetical protein